MIEHPPGSQNLSRFCKKKDHFFLHISQVTRSRRCCKTFFLSTLGYNSKKNKDFMCCLKSVPQNSMSPACDWRGKGTSVKKKDKAQIFMHIKKFHLANHYHRIEHAPSRLYLPSDVKVSYMHADHVATEEKNSLKTYRKCVKKKTISKLQTMTLLRLIGSFQCSW